MKTRAENEVDFGESTRSFWAFDAALFFFQKRAIGWRKERVEKGRGKAAKRPDVQRRPRRKPRTSRAKATLLSFENAHKCLR